MHNNSNMWNKRMVINTCIIVPFFKISRTHACKMTLFFLILRIRTSHWKNTPLFRENGYERGIPFGQECVCGGGGGCKAQGISNQATNTTLP